MAVEQKPKLRILGLHGYEQDEVTLRMKLNPLMAELGDEVEFVFVTAPNTIIGHDLSGEENNELQRTHKESHMPEPKGWYQLTRINPEEVQNLDVSIRFLEQVLETHGPFDGVLGFSQGAAMACALCALLEYRYKELSSGCKHPQFKFAILICAFHTNAKEYEHLFAKKIGIPSLHIYSVADNLISSEQIQAVQDLFVEPQVISFLGGHYIPRTIPMLKAEKEFISQFMPTSAE
ncbi:Ovarian cancer-associated protein 2 [Dipsacomyces acuminosporus]|nr:Ovarian cancer-associated protein 2 [Dipsacomyces acuminosporus]